jgi:TolB-like protein/Tfp pilus assembly protein PilF
VRYLFEEYAFDIELCELRRGLCIISITPQVFNILHHLIRNRGRVVGRDELMKVVWNNRIVSDVALTTRMNAARSAIGDSGAEQRLIKTLPRQGFRFVGRVQEEHWPAAVTAAGSPGERAPALPDRPSIAVLPFQNVGCGPEQEYLGDGLSEDIITALSRFTSLFVISRNSSFSYKERPLDVGRIGRELGVRYVLEGSVRGTMDRIRITSQLIESATGAHLWANRVDGTIGNIFEIQDQVTESIVGAIAPAVEKAELERAKRKPTESLHAYELYLRGLARLHQFTGGQKYDDALRLFNRAIELDPEFAAAYGRAAVCYAYARSNGWKLETSNENDEVRTLVQRAVEFGREDAIALSASGWALAYVVRDLGTAAALIDRALVLNSNLTEAWFCGGWAKNWSGEPELAIERFARALRLNPLNPRLPSSGTAHAHFFLGNYEEAVSWAASALQDNPDFQGGLRIYAASNAMLGRTDLARKAIHRLQQLTPTLSISTLRNRLGPYQHIGKLEQYEEGLRRAGLPN